MVRRHELIYGLNAGGVDPDAVARIDLEKLRLAGEHPVSNLLPRVLGPCTLRPGWQNLARITGDPQTRLIRFTRTVTDNYLLLVSPSEMRFMYNGAILQVPTVSTTINTGSWSNASTSPASAATSGGGTILTLTAAAGQTARLRQTLTISGGDQATVHILRVVVSRGPVTFRIGTSSGGSELLPSGLEVALDEGTHKLAFTPGVATVYVEAAATAQVTRQITQIQFESTILGGTGDLVLPTPWTSWADVTALRAQSSLDVLFLGSSTTTQRKVERRGLYSWGIAVYRPDDGPFTTGPSRISMTPSATKGNITVTATESYFKSGHVGALISIRQVGQNISETLTVLNQTTDYVTVYGVNQTRQLSRETTSSSFVGTVVFERSFDTPDPITWTTVYSLTNGAATTGGVGENDKADYSNVIVHYRWRVKSYTSGSVLAAITYDFGVKTGTGRITAYNSTTSVDVEVLKLFGAATPSADWRIGDWSDVRGYPRTPIIHDGRLHWFRNDQHYASKPDDYYVFDDDIEGDSKPFTRSVGAGGESSVVWAVSQDRLLAGTLAFEATISASELDEPLTATKYIVRRPSRRGCADIEAAAHDDGVFFVQRSGRRLYELAIANQAKYRAQDMSRLNPAAYRAGMVRLAVQQQPDTRVYAVMSDGTITVLTYDRDDKVAAVTTMSITDATIEDIAVLQAVDQDDVYAIVNRSGARYVERLGKEAAQTDVATCTMLDGYKVLTGAVSSISGAAHLASRTVQVWADGARRGDVALDGSGNGTLDGTYARVVYGRNYSGAFKSVKLAYAGYLGTALAQTKTVHGASLLFNTSCLDEVAVGRDENNTEPLPAIYNGAARTSGQFFAHYDVDIFPINSEWSSDARIYVSMQSRGGPCTLAAIVLDVETRDGASSRGQSAAPLGNQFNRPIGG